MRKTADEGIGLRLSQARQILGLSLKEVSDRMGYNNYQVLSEIEKGRRALKASELAKLSRIYVRDTWFFLQEEEPARVAPIFAWRARTAELDTTRAEVEFERILTDYQLLEDLVGESKPLALQPWQVNKAGLTKPEVEQLAERLSDELELGYRPAVNLPVAVEKRLHAKLLYLQMTGYGSAVSTVGEYGHAIIIDRDEAPWRRNFSLAHELFHLLACNVYPIDSIHRGNDIQTREAEHLAEAFAAALLMPREVVKKDVLDHSRNNRIDTIDLIRIALEYRVSTQALLIRLENLGLLRSDTVSQLLESPELETANRNERMGANKPARLYSERFVGLGVKALSDGRISRRKFCTIFDIQPSVFSAFIGEYGFKDELDDDVTYELHYA